ncbi:3'-5' exonuclease [Bacillus marinisedimentorum]|uniref:3'-5' exonuclease n=1 Tax=Bacillus marinisedimentorum TaxID=1821260 RepID=UPI0007DF8258|nr:exonuclease domain-containing protein [Bacillus marinisedimentorum]
MFWKRKPFSHGINEDIPLSTPVEELNFIIFDTETTGFEISAEDRLIEIAGVPMKGSTVLEKETFQTFVNPTRPIPEKIVELTGITEEKVSGAPKSMEGLSDFFEFVESRETNCLVGHYVPFDLLVLKYELARGKYSFPKVPAIDTLDLIGFLAPSWDMRDLERYAMAFGTRIYERHSALGDSLTTAYLFSELLRQFQDRGAKTWAELLHATDSQSRNLLL